MEESTGEQCHGLCSVYTNVAVGHMALDLISHRHCSIKHIPALMFAFLETLNCALASFLAHETEPRIGQPSHPEQDVISS